MVYFIELGFRMRKLVRLPHISSSGGSVDALKWLGLVVMTGDHINKYLYNNALPVLFEAGRLALPIFVFVVAFKMARSGSFACTRTIKRIALFGSFAIPGYVALGHDHLLAGWWPLNVMFTLLVVVVAVSLVKRGQQFSATSAVVLGGSLVEFWWPAVIFGVSCYFYCQQPSWKAALSAFVSCLFLCLINGNFWVLASIPLILVVSRFNILLPRSKWVFYSYYPLHLALIWLIRLSIKNSHG